MPWLTSAFWQDTKVRTWRVSHVRAVFISSAILRPVPVGVSPAAKWDRVQL